MMTPFDTRHPRLLLVLLCLALWLPGFFTLPPGDRDESRFAQGTKQMLETGDYVRIQNGAEARNRKPIGIHWLQLPFVAAADAAGLARDNPIWPYRIPSLLGGLVAVLASYGLGRRLLGPRVALLGAGMLASSVLLVVEVHIAKTDAALLGATTVAMALLGRAYVSPAGFGRGAAAGFWLAMGVGVLLKGPITPMVAGLAVVTLLVADRGRPGAATWLRELHAGWGVPLTLLVVVPWFVAIGLATHGQFFSDAVGGDLGRKLTSGDESHWGPPGLHLALLALLVFPAAAALPGGVAWAWRARVEREGRFLLAWIVPAWLVFEAAPTKLPHYTLPLYPAICLLLAAGVVAARPVWRWVGVLLAALGGVLLAAGAIGAPVLLHLSWLVGVPGLLAALLVVGFALRGAELRWATAAVVASVLLYAAALGWELPRLTPLWLSPRVVAALSPEPPLGAGIGAVGFAEPSLMFLGGTDIQWLRQSEAVDAMAAGRVDRLVVGDRDLAAVSAAATARGLHLQAGPTIPGYNYSRGRPVVLTILRPAPAVIRP